MAEEEHGWSWLFGTLYALLSRNPASNRVVAEEAALQPGERVLDVGCGSGSAMAAAAETVGQENVVGVDPTGPLAKKAQRRLPQARVEVAPAEQLPFDDDTFDVAWTIASHHHWEEPATGRAELARVLVPGGRVLLAERLMRREDGHGLTEGEARRLMTDLEAAGFENVELVRRKIKWYSFLILKGRRPNPD